MGAQAGEVLKLNYTSYHLVWIPLFSTAEETIGD